MPPGIGRLPLPCPQAVPPNSPHIIQGWLCPQVILPFAHPFFLLYLILRLLQNSKTAKYSYRYSACCLVRPWMEELIPEKNSLEKIPKPLKRWMGRPQLLPEIVENVLRSLWWGNGSKQPSPCLQPPKVGGLLRHLLLLLKAPLTSLHF